MAVARLASIPDDGIARTLFAYSYAAHDLLRFARTRAWRTVLGQIDGGPHEERIVAELNGRGPGQDRRWEPAPAGYWQAWREECALADRIVVNSPWARHALEEEGIPTDAIRMLPLAYEASAATAGSRRYPSRFAPERPLRVLFLGQINLRKGAGPLLEATWLLRDEPVEFWFVGPRQILVPADLEHCHNIRWFGPQRRNETAKFYREADVFILPTFSDGFGLTQLEAQSWKLPLIVSDFCGKVVQDGRNGMVLQSVTPEAIAGALRLCLQKPERLSDLAAGAIAPCEFGLSKLSDGLLALFPRNGS
jgi:glycosyltransferase involved in cell wall biosynthesis